MEVQEQNLLSKFFTRICLLVSCLDVGNAGVLSSMPMLTPSGLDVLVWLYGSWEEPGEHHQSPG